MTNYHPIFARYLTHIKRGSNGNYTARCPFHEDQNPSFSFNAETGLWQCFAGCGSGTARQFLKRVGEKNINAVLGESGERRPSASSKWVPRLQNSRKTAAQTRPEPAKPSDSTPLPPTPPQDYVIQATYTYTDIDGNILYLKDRFVRKTDPSDKTFRIRWCTDVKQTVFYGLNQLHHGIERIFFVEGEKCAEAVAAGLPESDETSAVLSYNSPSNEFEASQCLDFLAGRRIYIFGDNDEPGRRKAESLLNTLKPHVPVVHLWTFPDMRDKYDIADYLEDGGDLDHLIQSAPKVYESPLLELVLPDIPYYQVEELQFTENFHIPIGAVTLLAGTGGVGKSYVSLYMMLTLAAQENIPCLYVSLEDSRQVVMLRLKSLMGRFPIAPQDMPSTRIGVVDRVDPHDFMPLLEDAVCRKGYRFIFVDPIGALFDDENDNTEIQAFMRSVNGLCAQSAANVVLVHHLRKFALQSDDRDMLYSAVRGASAFVNNARLVWVVRKCKVNGEVIPNRIEMVGVKSNYGRQLDYHVENLFPGDDGVTRFVRTHAVDPFAGGIPAENDSNDRIPEPAGQRMFSMPSRPATLDDIFERRHDPIWQYVISEAKAQHEAREAAKAAALAQGAAKRRKSRKRHENTNDGDE